MDQLDQPSVTFERKINRRNKEKRDLSLDMTVRNRYSRFLRNMYCHNSELL